MGYKNAPDVEPKLGDLVECAHFGNFLVRHIGPYGPFKNCVFGGFMYLTHPEEAILVQSVDGIKPSGNFNHCKTCDYKKLPHEGLHCYMFKDEPERCGLHKVSLICQHVLGPRE